MNNYLLYRIDKLIVLLSYLKETYSEDIVDKEVETELWKELNEDCSWFKDIAEDIKEESFIETKKESC